MWRWSGARWCLTTSPSNTGADAREFVLRDISLTIRAGETVGIIGGTGSAKSTLVQLIPRLYDITEGTLLVDGRPVDRYPLRHLRDAIAMVLQKNTLFSGTVLENLRWGKADASEEEIREACRIACVDEFIHRLEKGYDTELGTGRRQCLRWAETAAVYCPGHFETAQNFDSGRFHQRCGHGDGGKDSGGPCQEPSGHHKDHHCPADHLRPPCGQDRGSG